MFFNINLGFLADANIEPFSIITISFFAVFIIKIKSQYKVFKINCLRFLFYSKKFQINPIRTEKSLNGV